MLDFIGYTTGRPSTPPPAAAGLRGAMDFVGYPVGRSSTVIPPQPIPVLSGRARPNTLPKKRRLDDDEELLLLI
jgi:hypothetical protein